MASRGTEVERALIHVALARMAAETVQNEILPEPHVVLAVTLAELLQAEVLLSRRIKRSRAQQAARQLLRSVGRDDDGIPSQW